VHEIPELVFSDLVCCTFWNCHHTRFINSRWSSQKLKGAKSNHSRK